MSTSRPTFPLDPQRRFTDKQRQVIYRNAEGNCQNCGTPLDRDWCADHVIPHTAGGRTLVSNGQALCPPCNLKKGAIVEYRDTFDPRPFQQDVINATMDGVAEGRRVTVVLASPGSGKTLSYQAVATEMYRARLIDYVAVFMPRLVLARQCELSWYRVVNDPTTGIDTVKGDHTLFDAARRISRFEHIDNRVPLIPPGQIGCGFAQTYSSLARAEQLYIEWAAANQGRFLLVADEAQFCGAPDEAGGSGTRAGQLIEELSKYAAHTLLLTGTPYRADAQPLVLCDYSDPDENGDRRLIDHAKASYADGVAGGYLRRFESHLVDIRPRRRYADNAVFEYDISTDGTDLAESLRHPAAWQPIVDKVVQSLLEKKETNPNYRALISCMRQQEAKQVRDYLKSQYSDLRTLIAVSDDGPAAESALRDFQNNPNDILVTVRKAFIGYDCPEITVVGILTHYRDEGHLMQLVGRGLRTWKGMPEREQSCRVIAPDDPKMHKFIEYMKGESEQGLRRREQGEKRDRDKVRCGDDPNEGRLYVVEAARATTTRAVSNDMALNVEQYKYVENLKKQHNCNVDTTLLAQILKAAGAPLGDTSTPETEPATSTTPSGSTGVPLTTREQIQKINTQVMGAIKKYLTRNAIYPSRPDYQDWIVKTTAMVNERAGIKAGDVRTVEDAQRRLNGALTLLSEQDAA